ncbi:MAG: alpha/beta fold hydrolase [Gemmatimonadaceae bacterium]|nr:alpha/beta fold hydrolase [Gloeobacterales cyanobacterium ES-bin-141]
MVLRKTSAFEHFGVEIPVEGAVLRGELLVPDSPGTMGVVFAPSSGLGDMHGNDADAGFAPLAQLAEGLAGLGIASLRVDRRGVGRSDGDFAGPELAIADFLRVLTHAGQLPELQGGLVLVGHGAGGALATVGAGRSPGIRGLVLIAPPVSPLSDLLNYRAQAEVVLAELPPEEHQRTLSQIQADYESRKPLFLFRPVLNLNCPVLAVQGAMDWIFPPAEAKRLVAEAHTKGKPQADLLLLEGLDHWLVRTTTWRSAAENLWPDWRVDIQGIEAIAGWIARL